MKGAGVTLATVSPSRLLKKGLGTLDLIM